MLFVARLISLDLNAELSQEFAIFLSVFNSSLALGVDIHCETRPNTLSISHTTLVACVLFIFDNLLKSLPQLT